MSDTPRDRGRRRTALAAFAGLLAGALTLGVAELLAAAVSATASPLLAVGGAFIDRTPAWLKNFAVEAFGTNDKLVLLVGMGLTVAVLAAVAGVLAARRWWQGAAVVLLLGAVAAAAAVTRAGAGPVDALPSLLGAAAGLLALRQLVARLPVRTRTDTAQTSGRRSRRSFLAAAGATAAAAALAAAGGRVLGAASRNVAAARQALRLPVPAVQAARVPADARADVPGMPDFVTANADFYRIDTALTVPQVDTASWRLRVHGLVEEEVELGFDDLLDAELVESWVTLTCVSNEIGGDLIGNAKWLGLPIREVLARARPLPEADMVLSSSVDGFTASTPLEALTDERNALLAIGMNGEPLPVEHGYPVRMVVPGLYGYVSATKWVVDLEVTRFADRTAYWTERGWAAEGPIKTMSRIDVPKPFARLPAGPVAVGGTAWAQTRGIRAVEVRVDDGEWQPASLAEELTDDTWRQWSFVWDATPGNHTLYVRATDGDGEVQTSQVAAPIPDGASGWHSRAVKVE